ncbi:MAG: glycosyltransferase family 87 protein, partial [Anaerolineae bacterium]
MSADKTVESSKRQSALGLVNCLWTQYRPYVLGLVIAIMAAIACHRMTNNFSRLLVEDRFVAAIDLRFRYKELHHWFAGRTLYREVNTAVYPPASYAMLWPFLGYSSFTVVRWIWGGTSAAALAWLVYLFLRGSNAQPPVERVFVALLPLSTYPAAAAIGHGQLPMHALACMLTGVLLAWRAPPSWGRDVLAGVLILAGLVKPSVTAPFFLLVLLPARRRAALIAAIGYAVLTLVSVSFQGFDLIGVLTAWVGHAVSGTSVTSIAARRGGYANLHNWLAIVGLERWNPLVSLLALIALGFWTYRHRDRDLWTLLGVVSIAARFWTYHRHYDDMLILVAVIALYRIARRGSTGSACGVLSGMVFVVGAMSILTPTRLLAAPPPVGTLF